MDFDEVAGSFSSSSVSSNRQLNETVGGMELLASGAGQVSAYGIRVFTETWAEPCLRQVLDLVMINETNPARLAQSAQRAKIQDHGVTTIDDNLMQQSVHLTVNVGIDATNPEKRVQKFLLAMNAVAPVVLQDPNKARLKLDEIVSEVFGAAGYKDGSRFIEIMDEEGQQEGGQVDPAVAAGQAEAEAKMQLAQMDQQTKLQIAQLNRDTALISLAEKRDMEMSKLTAMLNDKELERQSKERVFATEVGLKTRFGEGI